MIDISTDRLYLREINDSDAQNLVRWRSNPNVYRFFKNPIAISLTSHNYWYRHIYLFNENDLRFIGYEAFSNSPIGTFSISRNNPQSKWVEISYLLDPSAYGKGYASEAVTALCTYAKEQWNCDMIIAEIHVDNEASLRLVKRLGFCYLKQEGNFLIYKKAV